MWYKFDVQKFGRQMLPPILRRKVILALMQVFLAPLSYVMDLFYRMRVESQSKLGRSGLTATLVDVLSERFSLGQGDIWLEDIPTKQVVLYFQLPDQQAVELHQLSHQQEGVCLSYSDEGGQLYNYIVHIPSFLQVDDSEVRRIIDYYRPAGRKYIIQYYDYNG